MKDDAIILKPEEYLAIPKIPDNWDYEKSIKQVGGLIYKWKNITTEIAAELYIARDILSQKRNKCYVSQTWISYCQEIGIERMTAHRWLAKFFPKPELKITGVPALPSGKYRVVYADPPWQYSDKLIEGYGAAEHHYPTMSIQELCDMPLPEIEKDAVLFLWVTSPILEECFEIIKAWRFEYKASFVWNKEKHNYGHYNSVRHELLLICTRGSCLPEVPKLYDSVITIERTERHSAKPEKFREIIDELYPNGKRIELFARTKVKGWESWGNELP